TVAGARLVARSERAKLRPDAVAQLGGGLLREGDGEDCLYIDSVLHHRAGEALDQNRGLAATRARVKQQVALTQRDCATLLRRKPGSLQITRLLGPTRKRRCERQLSLHGRSPGRRT